MTVLLAPRPPEPFTIALAGGASILARIPDSTDTEAASAAMRRAIRAVGEGREALAAYGLNIAGPLLDDVDTAFGVGSVIMTTELALRCFVSWQGIEIAKDMPAPLDRLHIAMLLRDPTRHRHIQNELTAPAVAAAVEAKKSKPSPTGAPAGASPIAGTAERRARRARTARPATTASAVPNGFTNR